MEETGRLVADSLSILKRIDYLNIDVFEVLPINIDHRDKPIYGEIYNNVKDKLLSSERLIRGIHGGFTNTNNAILARGKDLIKLLSQKDLKILFDKEFWIDTNNAIIRDYLIKILEIKEIDFEAFAENITDKFMSRKKDSWIIQFYRKLLDQRSLRNLFYQSTLMMILKLI